MPSGNSGQFRRPFPKYGTYPAADPRRRLIREPYDGGPVRVLPVVLTIGVNAISTTEAHVIGSVNPNGFTTSWFVIWGTTLPLPAVPIPAQSTPAISLGNGNVPITVSANLTDLTPQTTYYVAVVGRTTQGTIIGNTIAFFTATTPEAPTTPTAQPLVTIPHFQAPFNFVSTGTQTGAATVEQDSLDEILSNVNVICECVEGQCVEIPAFGRPDVTFAQEPIDTQPLVEAIQQWEPRATEQVISQLNLDGSWGIILNTSAPTGANS